MEKRLDTDMLLQVLRQLSSNMRCFGRVACVSWSSRRAIAEVREELASRLCEEHRIESVRCEAAGRLLAEMAREGRFELVLQLIAVSVPLDLMDGEGHTALIWAVKEGHAEMVTALVKAGAELDVRGDDGTTAMSWAMRGAIVEGGKGSKFYQICMQLKEAGASMKASMEAGSIGCPGWPHQGFCTACGYGY